MQQDFVLLFSDLTFNADGLIYLIGSDYGSISLIFWITAELQDFCGIKS